MESLKKLRARVESCKKVSGIAFVRIKIKRRIGRLNKEKTVHKDKKKVWQTIMQPEQKKLKFKLQEKEKDRKLEIEKLEVEYQKKMDFEKRRLQVELDRLRLERKKDSPGEEGG